MKAFQNIKLLTGLSLAMFVITGSSVWAAPAVSLEQVRNGSATSPTNPGNWQNGNLNASQSHFTEGMSIPYRALMTDVPINQLVTVTIGFDVKHSDAHAIDYLTHYDRLEPHASYGHAAETLDPTTGVTGLSGTMTTFPLPVPGDLNTPVTGQPMASFNALPSNEVVMTLWGGTISNIYYTTTDSDGNTASASQIGDLSLANSEVWINVEFVADSASLVMSWGGHIGSRLDWGYDGAGDPRSAGGISGSPYHMRVKEWDIANVGNQDRSLSAAAVIPPPTCGLTGPSDVCAVTTNEYVIDTDATSPVFDWTLTNNTAGATFVGATNTSNILVTTTTDGSYDVKVVVNAGTLNSECIVTTTVNPIPSCSITGITNTCPGTTGLTYMAPAGMDTYSWSVTGDGTISGASTNQSVTVNAGSGCGTGFTVNLTVGLNGCSSVCSQFVDVDDTTPPVINSCPSDVSVQCITDVPAVNTNLINGTDNCSTIIRSHVGDVSDNGSCPEVITRTYRLTDACGNTSNCVQLITVNDTIAPSLVGVPADTSVECDNIPAQAPVTANDNCSTNLTVVPSTNTIPGICIGEYTLEYIWTVTDDCNNSAVATQSIAVVDTTPPVVSSCASNISVQCVGDVPAANTNLVSGTDNCGTVTVAWGGDVSNNGSCPEIITRSYTLTDDCGNATTCTVEITVNDTIDPVLLGVPADTTVECDSIPAFATVTALDNCSTNLSVIPSSNTIPGSCIGEYTLERIWTVTDDCNNSAVATQTITVVDTTPPVITNCASDITVQCIEDVPTPDTNLVSGVDNCGTVTSTWISDLSDSNSCPETITRTYQLSDDCGNATNCTVTITVDDTIAPVLVGVPADVTVECDNVPAVPTVTATDNCSTNLTVVPSSNNIPGSCEGEYTLERIWTVTDDCMNTTSATQTITVVDTTAPVIDTCASNITVQCFSDIPAPNTNLVTGTDNCGTVSATWISDLSDSKSCPETITRTYQLSDDCGNTTNCSVIITIDDTIDPVLVGVPTNVTVECDSVPPQALVTATDNCSTNLTVVPSTNKIDGACIGEYTLEYIWSVTDDCNNATLATQTVTVVDTTAPVIDTCASNVTVQCIGDVPPADTNLVSGTDNCGTVTVTWGGDVSDNGSCPEVITRTYILSDDCGNATNCTVSIIVNDTLPPVLVGVPTNVTVECDNVPPPAPVSATDNCDTNPVVSFNQSTTTGACVNSYVLTRTWTAVDLCSNSVAATQTVTVVDTTPPQIICPPTQVVDGDDNCQFVVPDYRNGVATDNCSVTGQIVVVQNPLPGTILTGPGSFTVSLEATDECGNTNNCSFPLDIRCGPAGIGITKVATPSCVCENEEITFSVVVTNLGQVVLSNITVTDSNYTGCATNLSSLGIGESFTYTCSAPATNEVNEILVSATAGTNVVNDSAIATWTIDRIPPVFDFTPTNITVECDAVPLPPNVTATDNCDTNPVVVLSVTNVPGLCPQEYQITRTWTATDRCGNATNISQIVMVVDTTPPVIDTCASNVTVQCIGDVPAPNTNLVSGTDNCGTVTVAWEGDLSDSNSCPEIITRTYSLTDDCGNSTNCSVTITVNDTISPVLVGVPANVNVECDNVPAQAVVTATDNCSTNLTVVPSTNKIDGACIGEYTLEYIWSVTDDCNNSSVATQTITVVDTTPPVIDTCASNVTVECFGDVPAPNTNLVSGTDNCGTVLVTWGGDVSDNGSCPELITRTYTLTDDCGNATNCSVTIMVNDTVNPVLVGIPTNITVECDSVPTQAVVTATDNCSTNLTVVPSTNKIDGACIGEYTLEYIWNVTDDCNNSSVATQSITVVDTTPPVIDTCVSNVTVECVGDVPAPNTNLVSGTDNCGTVTVAWEGDLSDSNSCPEIITRTYSLTDDCGNATNCVQLIIVNDTIAPQLVGVPSNVTVECDNVPPQATVTATDNCSTNLTVVPTSTNIAGRCIGEYMIEYVWSVTDDCNNSTVATQTVTVVDTTPPVIDTCASNVTVQCFGDVPAADTNLVSGTDNCGTVTVTWGGDVSDNGSCPEVITRTYTLTDDCGNATNCTVTITVNDTIPPMLIDVPTNITVECDMVPTQAVVTASDNCSTNLVVIPTNNVIPGPCIGIYTQEYIWSVTDDCNNTTLSTQSITVVDTTPPVVDTCASNVAVQCDTDIPSVDTNLVTGTDNCGTVTVAWAGDQSDSNSCPETITRTYTLTDDCGNATNCIQIITVHDTVSPEITCPSNVVLDCNIPFPAPDTASVIVSDNCSTGVGEIVVTHLSDVAVTNGCDVTVTRTYQAEDECGNSTNCVQLLSGHFDTEAPTVFTAGSSLVPCRFPDPGPGVLQVSDNCDPSPAVVGPFKIPSSGFGGCVQTDRYIWQITDNCGNRRVAVRLVTRLDLTPPPITCPPDVTVTSSVACIEFIPDFNVTVTDECAGAVIQTVQTPAPGTQVVGPTTVVVTLTATDLCGKSANCSFNYNIECTPGGEIGDYVWEDTNLDGLQDGVEPVVSNVVVRLYDGATNLLETTSTDTNGFYLFVNQPEGDYYVEFIGPTNGVFTIQDAGTTNDAIDSDVNILSGFTDVIALGLNETNHTVDAGLVLPAASIQLLKTVNIDALQNSCPGVELVRGTNGTPVTYCLVVTNTGNTYLSDVFVEDLDVSPTYTNTIPLLAPGASVTLAVPSTIQGDLINTASVVGIPAYSDGTPIPNLPPVMDDDPAEVREIDAGIIIRKTAYTGILGEGSAGCPGGEVVYTTNLAPVVYCLEVENVGLEYVVNIEVSDLDASPTYSTNLTVLAPGEIANLAFQAQVFGTLTNNATVNGSAGSSNGVPYPNSSPIYDDDTATVVDIDAQMVLEKTVYAGNSGSAGCVGAVDVLQVASGTTVTYCFEVSNPGSSRLTNPFLSDPSLQLFAPLGSFIDPGQSVTYTKTAVVTGSKLNTAQAQAQPANPNTGAPYAVPTITDVDTAQVVIVAPLQGDGDDLADGVNASASYPVSGEGIHRVSSAVLDAAGLTDGARIAVYLDGMEVAIHVDVDGGILFYVPAGTQEVLFGEKDAPLRMDVLPAPPLQ